MEWQEFTLKRVIDKLGVEAIVGAVDNKYVEELSEDYIGYNTQNITMMVKQLRTWYVITNKEKIDVKELFHKPWSDTPNYHITTFVRQIERQQVEYEDNLVIVTNADKVDHFVAQMFLSNIFKSKLLKDWEDSTYKAWASTKKYFVTQYKNYQRKIYCASKRTPYDISAVLHETTPAPSVSPFTSNFSAYDVSIEWAQYIKEQVTKDATDILGLKYVGGANTVVKKYAASVVAALPAAPPILPPYRTWWLNWMPLLQASHKPIDAEMAEVVTNENQKAAEVTEDLATMLIQIVSTSRIRKTHPNALLNALNETSLCTTI